MSTENAFFWRVVFSVNCLKQIFFGKTICFISDGSIMRTVQWAVNSWQQDGWGDPNPGHLNTAPPSEPTPWCSFWSSRVSPSYPDSSQTTHGNFSKKIQIFISIRQWRGFPRNGGVCYHLYTDTALALHLPSQSAGAPAVTTLATLNYGDPRQSIIEIWEKPTTLHTDLRPLFKNNLCRKHLVWDPLSTSNYAFRKSVPQLQSHQIPFFFVMLP